MPIKDLKAAADLYKDYEILKELQVRLEGQITDIQGKINDLILKIQENPEFPNVGPDENKYFEDLKISIVAAKDVVANPKAPDVVVKQPAPEEPVSEPKEPTP